MSTEPRASTPDYRPPRRHRKAPVSPEKIILLTLAGIALVVFGLILAAVAIDYAGKSEIRHFNACLSGEHGPLTSMRFVNALNESFERDPQTLSWFNRKLNGTDDWDNNVKGPSVELHLIYADGATLSFWSGYSVAGDTIRLALMKDPGGVDIFIHFDASAEAARLRAIYHPVP